MRLPSRHFGVTLKLSLGTTCTASTLLGTPEPRIKLNQWIIFVINVIQLLSICPTCLCWEAGQVSCCAKVALFQMPWKEHMCCLLQIPSHFTWRYHPSSPLALSLLPLALSLFFSALHLTSQFRAGRYVNYQTNWLNTVDLLGKLSLSASKCTWDTLKDQYYCCVYYDTDFVFLSGQIISLYIAFCLLKWPVSCLSYLQIGRERRDKNTFICDFKKKYSKLSFMFAVHVSHCFNCIQDQSDSSLRFILFLMTI